MTFIVWTVVILGLVRAIPLRAKLQFKKKFNVSTGTKSQSVAQNVIFTGFWGTGRPRASWIHRDNFHTETSIDCGEDRGSSEERDFLAQCPQCYVHSWHSRIALKLTYHHTRLSPYTVTLSKRVPSQTPTSLNFYLFTGFADFIQCGFGRGQV